MPKTVYEQRVNAPTPTMFKCEGVQYNDSGVVTCGVVTFGTLVLSDTEVLSADLEPINIITRPSATRLSGEHAKRQSKLHALTIPPTMPSKMPDMQSGQMRRIPLCPAPFPTLLNPPGGTIIRSRP